MTIHFIYSYCFSILIFLIQERTVAMLQGHQDIKVWHRGVIIAEREWTSCTCATVWYLGSVLSVWPSIVLTNILGHVRFQGISHNFQNTYTRIHHKEDSLLFDSASHVISTHQNKQILKKFSFITRENKSFEVFQSPFWNSHIMTHPFQQREKAKLYFCITLLLIFKFTYLLKLTPLLFSLTIYKFFSQDSFFINFYNFLCPF